MELLECSDDRARLITSSSMYACDGGHCYDGKDITCADTDCGGDFFGPRQSCLECNVDLCEACIAGGRWDTVMSSHPKHDATHTVVLVGTSAFEVTLPVEPVRHSRDTQPLLRWNTGSQSVPPESAAVLQFITGRGRTLLAAGGGAATAKGA